MSIWDNFSRGSSHAKEDIYFSVVTEQGDRLCLCDVLVGKLKENFGQVKYIPTTRGDKLPDVTIENKE